MACVEVIRDGKTHDNLTASVGVESIQLWADRYQITVPESGDLIIRPDNVEIRRGETVIARITQRARQSLANAAKPPAPNGPTSRPEATFEGKTLAQWLSEFQREVALEPSTEAAKAITQLATPADIPAVAGAVFQVAERTEFRDGLPHQSALDRFDAWAIELDQDAADALQTSLLGNADATLSNRQRLMMVRLLLDVAFSKQATLSDASVYFLRQQRDAAEDPWVRQTAHQALYHDAASADALPSFDWDQFDDPDPNVAARAALLVANAIEYSYIEPTDGELADRLVKRMGHVYDQSTDSQVLNDALVAAAVVSKVKRLNRSDVVETAAIKMIIRLRELASEKQRNSLQRRLTAIVGLRGAMVGSVRLSSWFVRAWRGVLLAG